MNPAEELDALLRQWRNRPDEPVQLPAEPVPVKAPARKRCPRCGRKKNINAFGRNASRKDLHSGICKPCDRKRDRLRYAAKIGKAPRAPRTSLAGLTPEERKERKRTLDRARRQAKRASERAAQEMTLVEELAQFRSAKQAELAAAVAALEAEQAATNVTLSVSG